MSFDIGDAVTVSATFTDRDGAAADPSTVTLRIKKPDDTVTVVNQGSLTNESAVGAWSYTVTIDQAGQWWVRWEGTGTVTAAEEEMFYVRARKVPAS